MALINELKMGLVKLMYKVEIEKLNYFAIGIGKIDGKIIFIPKTLKGDIVLVKIVKENKNYLEGRVVEYIKKIKRVGHCPYSDICGGCPLIDMNYDDQLELKKEEIKDLFKRNLGLDIRLNDVLHDEQYHYRNKITLHVKNNKLGYYQEKSNNLVEIDRCVIAKKEINEEIDNLKKLIKKYDIKDIIIRCHDKKLLSITGNVPKQVLLDSFPFCDSIYLNNVPIKDGYITDNILGNTFRISLHSFFQVNTKVCSKIFDKVISYIANKNYKKVLDLYCGTGIISIIIAKYVGEVVGVEVVRDAVEDACYNKKINNVSNVSFICDKVENRIDEFKNIDLTIIDPPRSGLDKKSVKTILEMNPKDIIYISCNPITLVRDLKELSNKYNVEDIFIADMFPNTYHVESICFLKAK